MGSHARVFADGPSEQPASSTRLRVSHDPEPRGGTPTDRDRVEQLFRSHFGELCVCVHGMVASTETAEDLVQDVFAAIWRQRATRPLGEIQRAYH